MRRTATRRQNPAIGQHVRGLDALRGVAIAVVLAFHARYPGFSGGFLGVSLFFTVSGFLITSIMLREIASNGRVDMAHFWLRRARRLLPAAVATVAVVVLASTLNVFGSYGSHRAAVDGIWSLGYAANWHFLWSGQSYAALFSAPSPLLHYWSLAIEEQYYILFPLVCFVCARRRHPRATLTAVLVAVLAVSVHAHLAGWGVNRMYYGTDVRVGEIVVGALLALVVDRARLFEVRSQTLNDVVMLAQFPVLAFVGWAVFSTTETSSWLFHGGLLALALCWSVLVLGAVLDVGLVGWLARVPALVALGVVSYGVYLVHWPLLLALRPTHHPMIDASLALGLTVVLAVFSYRFFEAPIRFGRIGSNARKTLQVAGVGVLGAVVVVSLTTTVTSSPYTETAGATSPPQTSANANTTQPATRVLVVGDSTGQNLGKALVARTKVDTHLVVDNQGVSGCALSDAVSQNMVRQEMWADQKDKCRHWATRMVSEQAFRPDIVFFVFGPTQLSDLRLTNGGAALDIRDQAVQDSVRREVAGLRGDFPNARFVFANAPSTFAASDTIPEADWFANDASRIAAWNAMVAELGAQPNSGVLDLARYIETLPGGPRNKALRPDGVHLHGQALTDAAVWISQQLEAGSPRS